MSIFNKTDSLSKEQKVAQQIDTELYRSATTLKSTYDLVRRLIYANPAFTDEYGVVDSDAIYAAFSQYSTSGLTTEQLGKSAMATKALINLFVPGTITDNVPQATITY